MISKIVIQNFKIFDNFSLELNEDINIIVGDNESGKSTILEAINLALTRKINGRPIEVELSPFYFNKKCVNAYFNALKNSENPPLPKVIIELYFTEREDLAFLMGANNLDKTNDVGVKLEIVFNDDHKDEYEKIISQKDELKVIPAEYYKINWYSFANNSISSRNLPINCSYIDATTIRLQSGTDYYLQNIINNGLSLKEKVELSFAYRQLKEKFSDLPSIKGINDNLTQRKGAITDKGLAISIDISQKSSWETNLVPHLDELPFQFIGKGEQSALKIMLALERQATDSHVILIEEPENHLSFASMNKLMDKIVDKCKGKQIIATTHSAYVLNKLGLEKLILVNCNNALFLKELSSDTYNYFKKLTGYDTLRLILAKKTILVEGPSDELIVQKAFLLKYGKLPIHEGVDVINVRGLSFARFLDIAKELEKDILVITDNDGDYENKITKKYASYKDIRTIKISADNDNDLPTLEPQLVKHNDIKLLNKIFDVAYSKSEDLIDYMKNNKTECALKLFETKEKIGLPKYIYDA